MTAFEALGGEAGIRALVDRFYDVMDTEPRAAGLRALHPADLAGSRDKLYWFLVGWTGGPQLYVERFGHPRLRARHMPFTVGPSEIEQWVMCMDTALAEVSPEARAAVREPIARLAEHMRNQ